MKLNTSTKNTSSAVADVFFKTRIRENVSTSMICNMMMIGKVKAWSLKKSITLKMLLSEYLKPPKLCHFFHLWTVKLEIYQRPDVSWSTCNARNVYSNILCLKNRDHPSLKGLWRLTDHEDGVISVKPSVKKLRWCNDVLYWRKISLVRTL